MSINPDSATALFTIMVLERRNGLTTSAKCAYMLLLMQSKFLCHYVDGSKEFWNFVGSDQTADAAILPPSDGSL